MPTRAPTLKINLQAIAYAEHGIWFAHCLELDIVAEGQSPDEAIRSLIDLCEFQIRVAREEGDLESVFRPAPSALWKMFALGRERRLPGSGKRTGLKNARPGIVHRFEVRELQLA